MEEQSACNAGWDTLLAMAEHKIHGFPHCVGGLAATSVINILFGCSNAYLWFCMLWGTNGLLQVNSTAQSS